MFMISEVKVIKLCDLCFGGGHREVDTVNGRFVKGSFLKGDTCPRCNGSGRIVVIDTTEIIPFVEED